MNDWKKRLGMVYSTNPDYQFDTEQNQEPETLAPDKQKLRVFVERKGRAGKVVTVVKGFAGSAEELKKLEKMLKNKCGTGGSAKDNEILLQGEMKDKVITILRDLGYTNTK